MNKIKKSLASALLVLVSTAGITAVTAAPAASSADSAPAVTKVAGGKIELRTHGAW